MTALLKRVRNILLHPEEEWQVIQAEPASYGSVILRYVAPLAALVPISTVMHWIIFDRKIPNGALWLSFFKYLLLSNLLWFCMDIINVVVTGVVISTIMAITDSQWRGLFGLRLAAYSFTPLFLVGFLALIPYMAWSLVPGILYGIYILYRGIGTLSSVRGMKSVLYAGMSFLAAAVIVGVMNIFEYMMEPNVARRVFL
jgi:hypothetical protein